MAVVIDSHLASSLWTADINLLLCFAGEASDSHDAIPTLPGPSTGRCLLGVFDLTASHANFTNFSMFSEIVSISSKDSYI